MKRSKRDWISRCFFVCVNIGNVFRKVWNVIWFCHFDEIDMFPFWLEYRNLKTLMWYQFVLAFGFVFWIRHWVFVVSSRWMMIVTLDGYWLHSFFFRERCRKSRNSKVFPFTSLDGLGLFHSRQISLPRRLFFHVDPFFSCCWLLAVALNSLLTFDQNTS